MGDEQLDVLLKKLSDSISSLHGKVVRTEKQGKKKLHYPIKKQQKGGYCFLSYMGNQQILNEIDHMLRFNESVLRFQTLKIENINSLATQDRPTETIEPPQENKDSE
jgi:small subunit ribosomal protein S6